MHMTIKSREGTIYIQSKLCHGNFIRFYKGERTIYINCKSGKDVTYIHLKPCPGTNSIIGGLFGGCS